jgi:hypothetical protein
MQSFRVLIVLWSLGIALCAWMLIDPDGYFRRMGLTLWSLRDVDPRRRKTYVRGIAVGLLAVIVTQMLVTLHRR